MSTVGFRKMQCTCSALNAPHGHRSGEVEHLGLRARLNPDVVRPMADNPGCDDVEEDRRDGHLVDGDVDRVAVVLRVLAEELVGAGAHGGFAAQRARAVVSCAA